jgi:hypothetical protein
LVLKTFKLGYLEKKIESWLLFAITILCLCSSNEMESLQNVELEAAKFLHKLIQDSKDEPAKLATKLYVVCVVFSYTNFFNYSFYPL